MRTLPVQFLSRQSSYPDSSKPDMCEQFGTGAMADPCLHVENGNQEEALNSSGKGNPCQHP